MTNNAVSNFADGIKQLKNGAQSQDLNKIFYWLEKCRMSIIDKCKVLHVWRNNDNCQYIWWITAVTEQRDIGDVIRNYMKPSKQNTYAVNKANRIMRLVYMTSPFKKNVQTW